MYIKINNKKFNIINLNNFKKKTIGLMFRKDIIKDIYLLNKCNAIHTYFMKQNIDICILDKNNKIVLLKSNLSKNKVIICKNGYKTLEMPLNTCKYLKLGNIIEFKNES